MMNYIGKLFVNGFAVMITAFLLPGVHVENYLSALSVAIVLSLLNTFIKPLLIILTIPVTIMTFGLFLIIINVLIISLADDLIDGFSIDGFWWTVLFSFLLSVINSIFNRDENNGNNKKYKFK